VQAAGQQVFKVLPRAGYKWVIRLDTDSRLPSGTPYNLAAVMEAQNATYGFRAKEPDDATTLTGLMEAVAFWAVTEQVQPTHLLEHCAADQPAGTGGLPTPHGHQLQVFCRWGAPPGRCCVLQMRLPVSNVRNQTAPGGARSAAPAEGSSLLGCAPGCCRWDNQVLYNNFISRVEWWLQPKVGWLTRRAPLAAWRLQAGQHPHTPAHTHRILTASPAPRSYQPRRHHLQVQLFRAS
jgi:hypothetical protein